MEKVQGITENINKAAEDSFERLFYKKAAQGIESFGQC